MINSFRFAGRGFLYCVKNERNMRIHLTAVFYVLLFSTFYDFEPGQYAVLLLVFGLALVAEMVNTAIEVLCDMLSPKYSEAARIAKDVAAGAVFVSAVVAVAVAMIYFFDMEVLRRIWNYFLGHAVAAVMLLLSFIFAFFFIRAKK